MTVNNVSMNSSTNIYATNYSNTSPSQQQNQTTAGATLNAMDALLANVGQKMGLSPAQIDAGQAIMHAAFGDNAGAAQNCREAANNYLAQQSPIDRGYIENTQANVADSGSQTALDTIRNANNTQQCADDASGTKGKAKNFFEALAEAMGKILGQKMKDLDTAMRELEQAGGPAESAPSGTPATGTTGTTGTTGNGTSENQQTQDPTGTGDQAKRFGMAQSKFTAESQMFGMISNLVNTSLKTIGESLSTIARKG